MKVCSILKSKDRVQVKTTTMVEGLQLLLIPSVNISTAMMIVCVDDEHDFV
jgi:hypothetical protein